MSVSPVQPDPSVIGGVPKAPFALMPNLARLFNDRASRFEALAQGSHLAPYLNFLAGITRIQSELVSALPPPEPVPADRVERARANAMPPHRSGRDGLVAGLPGGVAAIFLRRLKPWRSRLPP
ncbi:formate dehydrogenase accessory protein FdhE (plasmid) [Sinorhizobium meliloti]|nr:formate dehydrogenase accessory protein FdhE [Sinorhizobium meliloti]